MLINLFYWVICWKYPGLVIIYLMLQPLKALNKYCLMKTGNKVKKTVFISAPYFPGLSESFKQFFRYTHIQVCFKGQNTALNQVANLFTFGRSPGHFVNMSKNIARKGPILLHTNIVTLKAIHSPALTNSKL